MGKEIITETTFSEGFHEDLEKIIAYCMENNTDRVNIQIDYSDAQLEVELKFYIKSGKVEVKDD